jgi:hypothetical protein
VPRGHLGGCSAGRNPCSGELRGGKAVPRPALVNRALLLPLLALLGACATAPTGNQPSLAPRAAEAIDPRLPVPNTSGQLPASAELRAVAEGLLAQARAGTDEFNRAAAAAEQAASAAGGRDSDSWVRAQQLLSAAVAARSPVTNALGDIDELAARAVRDQGGLVPADLDNIRAIAGQIASIDSGQAARIAAIQARLAR